MRTIVLALLLAGAPALSGCGSAPADPYGNMKMLSPEEVGGARREADPVLDAERAHNAQFAGGAGKKSR